MRLDIIIPAFNNEGTLPQALSSLYAQTISDTCQSRVIIADDGSTDNTQAVVNQIHAPKTWRPNLILELEHGGAATARNHAINESDADIVLFLGADMEVTKGTLLQHINFHDKNPDKAAAALGMVTWHPSVKPTAFMEWMVHGGPQNNFDDLLGVVEADPKHAFFGSHISLKREFLGRHRFSDEFTGYGWEDFDLGRRLAEEGLKLYVLHAAKTLHNHFYTVQDIQKRQYAAGKGIVIYQELHPEDSILPESSQTRDTVRNLWQKTGLQAILEAILMRTSQKYTTPSLFQRYTALEFWKGVFHGREGRNSLNRGKNNPK